MSGRGRGVSNLPAWMTRGDDGGPGGGPPGLPPPMHAGGSRGPPPPHHYDDRRSRAPDPYPPPPRYRGDYRGGGAGGDYRGGGGGGGGYYRDGRDDYRSRGPPSYHRQGGPRRGSGGGGGRRPPPGRSKGHGIVFHSLEEERAWVEERRRKRKARPSLFDKQPTAEQALQDAQAASMTNHAATDFSGVNPVTNNLPQQTRHARRLYVGNLPPNVTEDELHHFFRDSIEQAISSKLAEDPILSVYINQERRFCFLEFKSVEMTTGALALDGINVNGKGKVKIKRPNDYNPSSAPDIHPAALPNFDVSKLGIISATVPDGPNKIFVGGLHYHLLEDQILELLGAFGKVKGFHLVKNDPDGLTSKGYCFVEYVEPNVTAVAVAGLNGMDLGGGKTLTARIANAKDNALGPAPLSSAGFSGGGLPPGVYHVEELVDAAMGLRPMPIAPSLQGQAVIPLTPSSASAPALATASVLSGAQIPRQGQMPPLANHPNPSVVSSTNDVLEIANAAAAALAGNSGAPTGNTKTRILVLMNLVMDEDLATEESYQELLEDIRSEGSKSGTIVSIQIPRPGEAKNASAVKKVFIEYATLQDATKAEQDLTGRQFGPNIVQTSFFSEQDYRDRNLF